MNKFIKVFFYKKKKLCSYKKNWYQQIKNGINTYSKKMILVDNLLESNIIFTIKDYVQEIEENYDLIKFNIKLIIISCNDPVTINKELLENENILYIFDHLKLDNIPNYIYKLNNNNDYSYSHYLLAKYYEEYYNENKILIFDDKLKNLYFDKVKCILNTSYLYNSIFDFSSTNIINRKYDILYIANLEYKDSVITKHRKDIISKLENIAKIHNFKLYINTNIPQFKFRRLLKNSKIMISPWGWGEWSLKEFECICYGTHSIVPNKHLINYPNFLYNFDEYLLDFSNLEEIILKSLNNINDIQIKINENRKKFLNYSNKLQIESIDDFIT